MFFNALYYLASDHLGSTSVTYNTSGGLVAARRYMPWGEERYSSGTMPTMYRYTGQYSEPSLGLYFYNARWYGDSQIRTRGREVFSVY